MAFSIARVILAGLKGTVAPLRLIICVNKVDCAEVLIVNAGLVIKVANSPPQWRDVVV